MASVMRILIVNPNTSTQMTDALRPVVEGLGYAAVEYTFFTSPSPGVPSINSPHDARVSAEICLPTLIPLLAHHDAVLVACYSQHPLVSQLKAEYAKLATPMADSVGSTGRRKYVTGILEASVVASLALVDEGAGEGFGIVSTGKVWEEALQIAVDDFLLGQSQPGRPTTTKRFHGCETTGLNASELHDLPADEVRQRMVEATKRLLRRAMPTPASGTTTTTDPPKISAVKAICLGCAGMVGLDSAVRSACVEELGPEQGNEVYIVDGVKAGVGVLYGLVRCGF